MRARLENIPILLGSATPSLESWHNAQRGQYTLLQLAAAACSIGRCRRCRLIDLRHDGRPRRPVARHQPDRWNAPCADALRGGGQVMLLLNRRGFSTHVHCPSCGHVEQCQFCDLSLTFHRERDVLLCHYCGYEQPPPERCPKCGQAQVRYQGTRHREAASRDRGEVPELRRAAHGQRHDAPARQPRAGAGRVPRRARSTSCSARR